MGRIGEPKREIHIPVPPPAMPVEAPEPNGEPNEPVVAPQPQHVPIPTGSP